MTSQMATIARPGYNPLGILKYLLLIGIMIGTLPFWLPTSLGGDTSYHFVLTDSMKGTLDPGAFVVLRQSDTYEVGDAVGYWLDLGNGDRATILHRIVGRLPNGNYILKGDAVESTEEVEEAAITGRMVFAIPGLGLVPGAFRQAPMLLGGMLVVVFFLTSGIIKKADRRTKGAVTAQLQTKGKAPSKDKSKEGKLFIPAALAVLVSLPFATGTVFDSLPALANLGPAEVLFGNMPLFVLLLGFLAITRLGEVVWVDGPNGSSLGFLSGINYTVIMLVAATLIPFMQLVESARTVFTL